MGTDLADDLTQHQVDLDEIRTFDNDAQDLVRQYHAAGWTSRRSTKGHVIAYAPDGVTSASISRDSLRGRSGRNAAAPLKKWLRDQEEKKAASKGAAFGITDIDEATKPIEERFGSEVPPRIAQQLRGARRLIEYVESLESKGINPFDHRLAIGGVRENTARWYVADTVTQQIIIHSEGVTLDEAYDDARESGMLPPVSEADEMKMFQCPDCDERYATQNQLTFHRQRIHDGYTCPECQAPFSNGSGLAAHREKEHDVWRKSTIKAAKEADRWCAECKKAFRTRPSYLSHRGRAHPSGELGERTRPQMVAEYLAEQGSATVQQIAAALEWTPKITGPVLARMAIDGRVVRVDKGTYRLPGDVTVTSPDVPPERADVAPVVPAVTPSRDTEGGDVPGDVPVSSPVSPLTDLLTSLPDGDTAVDMVAKIRAVVTPPLVAQLREVSAERDRLVHENELLSKELGDLQARFELLKEALGA